MRFGGYPMRFSSRPQHHRPTFHSTEFSRNHGSMLGYDVCTHFVDLEKSMEPGLVCLRNVHRGTLRDKEPSCEIHKAMNVKARLLRIERSCNYVGLTMCPQCPRKDGRGQSCCMHPREIGPEVVQGSGGVTKSANCLVKSQSGAKDIF